MNSNYFQALFEKWRKTHFGGRERGLTMLNQIQLQIPLCNSKCNTFTLLQPESVYTAYFFLNFILGRDQAEDCWSFALFSVYQHFRFSRTSKFIQLVSHFFFFLFFFFFFSFFTYGGSSRVGIKIVIQTLNAKFSRLQTWSKLNRKTNICEAI